MTIKEKIIADMKVAMKEQNKVRLNALRNISAAFQEFEKEKSGNEVVDPVAISILSKLEKKRKESIDLYEKGNRPEFAEQERLELAVIQEILPLKYGSEQTEDILREIIAENGFSGKGDLGKVMKIVSKEYAGVMDMQTVRHLSESILQE